MVHAGKASPPQRKDGGLTEKPLGNSPALLDPGQTTSRSEVHELYKAWLKDVVAEAGAEAPHLQGRSSAHFMA